MCWQRPTLVIAPKPITDLIGKKGKNQGSMRDVPLDQQTEYAAEDADITWQLKEHFEKELGKNEQRALLDKVELPLVRVLAAMEVGRHQHGCALFERNVQSLAARSYCFRAAYF